MVDFSNPLGNYLNEKDTVAERKKVEEDLSDIIELFNKNENGDYRPMSELKETIFSFDENTVISVEDFGQDVLSYALGSDNYDPDDFETLLDILDKFSVVSKE